MSWAPIPILTYHQIAPAAAKGAPFRSLSVAPADFARHMAFLARLGYRGLGMSELLPYLQGERSGRVVGITFDDGYLNNLEHAAPILQQHGFGATCYALSQMLGATNRWDAAIGVAQTPLMTASQLRQWTEHGLEVGAHGREHLHLPSLPRQQAQHEIEASRRELEDLTGTPVRHFCYPYGDFQAEHAALVQAAGYLTATTTFRGRCKATENVWQLPRVPVLRSTTRLQLWLKVATAYEDCRRTELPLE